jgi:asparagine synthetase B (glutamine-hydrolysing)
MSGFAGIGALRTTPRHLCEFLHSTDLTGSGHRREVAAGEAVLGVSAPSAHWLERRVIAVAGAQVVVAGTPVQRGDIDWPAVVEELRAGRAARISALSGRFALAVLDSQAAAVFLITDRIGQHPLYVRPLAGGLAFSTSQASFCALPDAGTVEERWIHETLLFNFSASHGSFLPAVRRLPGAMVLRLELRDGAVLETRYAERFRANVSKGPAAREIERGAALFAERMPLYLQDGERGRLGLTAGFDSRTLLAYFADRTSLETYTYGVPGCADLAGSAALTHAIGLRHRELPFDANFTQQLADHAVDAVWLSSGLERVARATLPYVYGRLAAGAPPGQCILSGVSADQLFRGHGNVPSIVSGVMDRVFRTGGAGEGETARCESMFTAPVSARRTMMRVVSELGDRYGDLRSPASHLGYMTYEVPAEYFSGEASIADHFADFRSPFCDTELIGFAHTTALSTLGFSKFALGEPDVLGESRLPAALIAAHPLLARHPIAGKPLWVYARGSHAGFEFHRAKAWVLRRLARGSPPAPLEDWRRWFSGPLWPFLSALLGSEARLNAHVRRGFIDACLQGQGPDWPHWLNKLATVELVLRLTERGWRRLAPAEVMSAGRVAG